MHQVAGANAARGDQAARRRIVIVRVNASIASDIFLRPKLARFLFEHDRDVVSNRIGQPARTADKLAIRLAIVQAALADRAYENVKELGVHATGSS
jgi:hypothetical protein